MCVYFSGVTYFSHANCVHLFPSSQFLIIMFNFFLSYNIFIMRCIVCVPHHMLTDLILDDVLKCTKQEYCTNL